MPGVAITWRSGCATPGRASQHTSCPHLFERFYRIPNARARTHEGTGIGLALVQELVRLHGGEITVVSEVGVGTTFTVTIPTGTAHLPADRVGGAASLASTTLGRTLMSKRRCAGCPTVSQQTDARGPSRCRFPPWLPHCSAPRAHSAG